MSESKELIRRWIDAFVKKDLEAVMNCYADDAVNFQVAVGAPAVGKEQIRKDTVEFFRAFPDSYSIVENIIADEDWAAGNGTAAELFPVNFMARRRPANHLNCAAAAF